MSGTELPLLLLFVKYPEPGRVKTRLAADSSAETAATIYRRMVTTVLGALPAGQPVRVLYDGFRPESDYREWLDHAALATAEYAAQSTGDLGDRLTAAFAKAFVDGWQRVGVIGSDCLELHPALYAEAWKKLAEHDLVIGPTCDGGYYFLALKKSQPALFQGITWSSETVFSETRAAAEVAGLTVAQLSRLRDIDTWADWLLFASPVEKPAA